MTLSGLRKIEAEGVDTLGELKLLRRSTESRSIAPWLPSEPAVYMPYPLDDTNHVLASMNLFVRSAGADPSLPANSVRKKIQSSYPDQPIERIIVMREVVSREPWTGASTPSHK